MKETLRYLAGIAGPSGYGSKSTAEQVTEDCSCNPSHLTAIITGATSGIGAETARVLAKRGVRIVIPARDLKKAAEVKEGIQRESPQAEIILNNAGIFSKNLEFSEDKMEMTFATNYLEMLLEKMIETAAGSGIEGRIIDLSSVIHSWVKKDEFCFDRMLNPKKTQFHVDSYNGTKAYAQSKLANILHAKEVSRQLKGAATTCYVALSPKAEGVTGKYFADCNDSECSALANDETEPQKLWKQTRALIQRQLLHPPPP
ncbi:hypothetical protein JRO89_XS13G0203700 [Xanthoceras sorbifolium]|uniref:Uncharacterized protein n=1 Tax=Xanthoceras sorbifolium TaxID=99658 RepID=A0ABQ8H993_9ROSI|nr:hypothetical protein JRO89_XS13G0203700 [Xanthoceras sorbifolium]